MVASATQYVFADRTKVGWSILLCSPLLLLVASLLMIVTRRNVALISGTSASFRTVIAGQPVT